MILIQYYQRDLDIFNSSTALNYTCYSSSSSTETFLIA